MKPLAIDKACAAMHPLPWGEHYFPGENELAPLLGPHLEHVNVVIDAWHDAQVEMVRRKIGPWY